MITVKLDEIEFHNKIDFLDRRLRNKFISKTITETEFKHLHKIIGLCRVYCKLNLIKFL